MVDQESVPPGGFQPLAGEPNPFGTHPRGRSYNVEVPLTKFASERELADRVIARLEQWFHVRREVWGTHCTERRLRADAIISPRDNAGWRNPDAAFGVGFKLPCSATASISDYTRWIAQAVSYTHVNWPGCGRLIVLTCPGAATWLDRPTDGHDRELYTARRLVGQLGVGELVLRWASGLTILVNGEPIWSERHGVTGGRTFGLKVKTGNSLPRQSRASS